MLDAVIDLSHHNTNPDYAAIAGTGIKGVIYKVTQGTTGVDPTYATSEPKARAEGLWWGAYHFGTGSEGVAQAQHFLAQIANPAKTLMVLDFEPNPTGPSMSLIEAHAFVSHVHATTRRWPGVYSGTISSSCLGLIPIRFSRNAGSGSRNMARRRWCRRAGRLGHCGNIATARSTRRRRCRARDIATAIASTAPWRNWQSSGRIERLFDGSSYLGPPPKVRG